MSRTRRAEGTDFSFLDGRLRVRTGDITRQTADVIVNAANSGLMGGGGVDGAIHRAGGPAIMEECRAIRRERFPDGLPAGESVETTAGRLPARYVIHTVGPVWHGGNRSGDGPVGGGSGHPYRVGRNRFAGNAAESLSRPGR